jgi:hypothetical protein
MFKVIDNSIPFHFQESLKQIVLDPDLLWSYAEHFSSDGLVNNPKRTKYISKDIDSFGEAFDALYEAMVENEGALA